MNGRACRGDENGMNRQAAVLGYQRFLSGPRTQDPMTSGITAFMVAVGGTSLICYLLMNRVQNRKSGRESAGGDTPSIGSSDSSGGGWNLLSWFGSDSSSSDSSTSSSDSGGDSGGGGVDGGGGGD
jgi:hypothetical protein